MTTKFGENKFVRIQIASPSMDKSKEFFLTRFQFEILFFSVPIVFMWGIISTLFLVKTLYLDGSKQRHETSQQVQQQPLQYQTTNLSVVNKSIDNSPTISNKSTTPFINTTNHPEAKPSEQEKRVGDTIGAARSFSVDDIFNIDLSIVALAQSDSYEIDLAMTNLKGEDESGRYWISFKALTSTGEAIWITPMPAVKIDDLGQAQRPELGKRYSFRNFRRSTLNLKISEAEVLRFDEAMIGFARENKQPAMAKVYLNPR